MGGVEVAKAKAAFSAGGHQYDAGSYVILMAQPNRGYAKDLLEPQHHPNRTNGPGGPPKRQYDMAGWTLPYQMGVRADAIKDPFTADLDGFSRTSTTSSDRKTNDAVRQAMDALTGGGRVAMTATSFVVNADAPAGAKRLHAPRVGVYK